ncbi:MAG: hypothetical protein RLZZ618_1087 [Pseudomonadota bacterium]|jgi:hypothetical protein
MKRIVLAGCLVVLFGCAMGAEPTAAPAPASAKALPPDVARFIEQADLCEHFLGEEPYDKARARELARNIAQYCKGKARQLARLRARYAQQPEVIKSLAGYEFSAY